MKKILTIEVRESGDIHIWNSIGGQCGPWDLAGGALRGVDWPVVNASRNLQEAIVSALAGELPADIPFRWEGDRVMVLDTVRAEDMRRARAAEDFARWVISLDDPDPDSQGFKDRKAVTMTQIIGKARGALNQPEEV